MSDKLSYQLANNAPGNSHFLPPSFSSISSLKLSLEQKNPEGKMIVNILIGATITLLPLYNRIVSFDFSREFKDNLFVGLSLIFGFLLQTPTRKIGKYGWFVILYLCSIIIFNSQNFISPNFISQSFYSLIGITFFVHYYQKHLQRGLNTILVGCAVGAILQSIIGLGNYYQHEWYHDSLKYLFCNRWIDGTYWYNGFQVIHKSTGGGPNNMTGSLGNVDLWASYVALSSLAFLGLPKKYLPLMILPLTALILSHNVMGACSCLGGIIYYLNVKYEIISKSKVYLMAIVPMIALPFFEIGIDHGRFSIWRENLSRLDAQGWIWGNGVGWFADLKMQRPDVVILQEHNAFFTFLNVFGLMGLLLLLPIFYRFLKSKDTTLFSSILFAAFCNSYGHFTLNQSTVVLIMTVSLAICLGEADGMVDLAPTKSIKRFMVSACSKLKTKNSRLSNLIN